MILEELEVYRIALELSKLSWEVYSSLPKEHKFSIGSQFLESADSVGANIAEGYGRYHYKDSIKFYYNSRGSLSELKHWNTLLSQRNLSTNDQFNRISELINIEQLELNNFINSIKSKI